MRTTRKGGDYMSLSIGEKLRIVMKRQGINMSTLADAIGQSRQNLSNKFARDNFTEKEIQAISDALGCEFSVTFTLPDGTTI